MKRSFLPLFATNFFGVVNDNFLKTLASFTVIGWLADERLQSVFMGTVAAALVVPYVVFSPLADRLTALFPKVRIFRLAKWAELPIVALAVAGFALESAALVVASVLLMGLQSALYSPAKYALVRDVGGADRISTGMGGMEGVAFAAVLAVLAFDLGFFKLPFDAEIQKVVKGPRLNTMLAYFNQVSFLFMMFASLSYVAVSALFGPRAFLLLLAAVLAVVPLVFVFNYRTVLCRVGKWVFGRRYAVTVEGLEALPEGVPLLFLPNHPAMVDPMLVGAELWRRGVKPLADELFLDRGGISAKVLKTLGCVKVPDLRKRRSVAGAKIARGLQDVVTDALARGDNVIFYPSGHIWTEPREEIGTRQLAYNVCRALPPDARVVAVRTTGLWGSIWSRKGRTASPAFGPTLVRSFLLWLFAVPFMPRRRVTMRFEDITVRAREWANGTRLDFNHHLEDWYNDDETDAARAR